MSTLPTGRSMSSNTLHRFSTAYNSGRIVRQGQRIDMEVEGAVFATWHPDRLLTGYSWDALSAVAVLHPSGSPQQILLLGLAGGTVVRILRHLFPSARITAVEIDEELVDIATRYMHLDETALSLHVGDAYEFLKRSRRKYDVILDDVYLAGIADVYRPALSDEHTELYKRRLRDNGLIGINLITDGPHRPLLRSTRQSFKRTFPCVRSITAPRGYNQMIVGGMTPLDEASVISQRAPDFPETKDRTWWRKLGTGDS